MALNESENILSLAQHIDDNFQGIDIEDIAKETGLERERLYIMNHLLYVQYKINEQNTQHSLFKE